VDHNKLQEINPAAARELIQFDQRLCLRFIHWSWSDELAVALGGFCGERLELECVRELSDRAAAALSKVQSGLVLPDVQRLTLAAAHSLNRVNGPLSLGGLKTLDAATLAALTSGRVWLEWEGISPTVRQQLEGWRLPANAIRLPDLYKGLVRQSNQ
jgi:hypothetical protein